MRLELPWGSRDLLMLRFDSMLLSHTVAGFGYVELPGPRFRDHRNRLLCFLNASSTGQDSLRRRPCAFTSSQTSTRIREAAQWLVSRRPADARPCSIQVDKDRVQDTIPTERTWSVIIASCCVLVSRLKALSGKNPVGTFPLRTPRTPCDIILELS